MNNEDITAMWTRQELGYSNRPVRQRRSVYGAYLDSCSVFGLSMVTGDVPGQVNFEKIILRDDNYNACISAWLSAEEAEWLKKRQYWTLDWLVTPSGWIQIPMDWNYTITVHWWFRTDKEISWATPPALTFPIDSESKVIYAFTNVAKEWDAISWYVWLNAQYSCITPATTVENYTWQFAKWVVLYIYAAHRWAYKTFPIIWWFYITKIS